MSYFDAVIGQDRIKAHMKDLINRGTLPHSLLFYGEEGLGKFTMAKAVASTLLGRSVGKHLSEEPMSLYAEGGDFFLLRPMVSTGLKISQWQQLLKDYLSKTADGIRIVVIDEFQTARHDFTNALLKSIEEPPAGVYFILITTKKDYVLPTIISRCMLVPFVPVSIQLIEEELIRIGERDGAKEIAALSRGNIGRALTYSQHGGDESLEMAYNILDALASSKRPFSTGVLYLNGIEKEPLVSLLEAMRLLGRDMLALKYGVNEGELYCPQYLGRLDSLSKYWSIRALQSILDETLKAEEALRLHIRVALVVDGLLLALRRAIKE